MTSWVTAKTSIPALATVTFFERSLKKESEWGRRDL
jgi:hypothetical protein